MTTHKRVRRPCSNRLSPDRDSGRKSRPAHDSEAQPVGESAPRSFDAPDVHELPDAREVLVVDDLGDVLLVETAIVAVQVLPDFRPEFLHQRALLPLLDEDVIGADTRLPAVELLGRREIRRDA